MTNIEDEPRKTLADGTQIYPTHREITASGMQRGYVVLAEEERAKGFIRPFRDSYIHTKCGGLTTMARSIAETYARNPNSTAALFVLAVALIFPLGKAANFYGTEQTKRLEHEHSLSNRSPRSPLSGIACSIGALRQRRSTSRNAGYCRQYGW